MNIEYVKDFLSFITGIFINILTLTYTLNFKPVFMAHIIEQ